MPKGSPSRQPQQHLSLLALAARELGIQARAKTLCPIGSEHGTMDWFQIGKGVRQGCILSPCLFNFYAEHFM